MMVNVDQMVELLQSQWAKLGIQFVAFQLAALVFYFLVSGRFNPFSVSRNKRTRNRVRYARNIAFSLFQGSIVLFLVGDFAPSNYIIFTLVMSLLIIVPSTFIYVATNRMIDRSMAIYNVQDEKGYSEIGFIEKDAKNV